MFRKAGILIFIGLAITLIPLSRIEAQVAVIDYVKITPESEGDYLKLEERWKAIHEAQLKKELIISWGLYEVMFSGSSDPYNYATVTVYENLDMYDRSWDISSLTESYPDMDDEEINTFFKQTRETKNIVRSVVLRRLLTTSTKPGELPAYVLVNGMKVVPGADSEYLEIESDIFMPIHEEGIRQNVRAGWALWEKFYGGNYGEFQYVTLDAYYSFKQIDSDITEPLFKKLNPGKEFSNVLTKVNSTRSIVTREVWRLLTFVESEND